MNTYELFAKQGRGFFEPVNGIDIRRIIAHNPNGICLWVKTADYYMEVDCPNKDNMNARFEADGKIINKLFPYNYEGFIDACDWFDEQRVTYRFARFIGGKKMRNRDWLNNMALIDMLDMISKNLAGCLIYHMNGQNYDGACGRCSKYNGSCYNCISAWLNEEHKN